MPKKKKIEQEKPNPPSMIKKTKSKVRRIKIEAWAVLDLRKGNSPIFVDSVEEIGYHEAVVNIFLDKKEAKKYHKWTNLGKEMKLAEVEITYKLPLTPKKK